MQTSKILGIDLGTTNSAVAIIEAGEPKVLENDEGGRTTPSIVAISKSGDRLVGLLAKRQAVTNPENTIYSVKRLIGRKFEDEEVKKDKELLPYKIEKSDDGGVKVKMSGKGYRPEEISAMILQKLKHDAEARLGGKAEGAIITVPAYFNDSQRKATKDAGEIAGLKVLRIINEPTAAALAYGFNKKKDEKIVVYDFGGGTFDVSVLEVGDDVIEVKSTGGDTHLGGDNIDQIIMGWVISEFKKQSGIDVAKDILALQRIKEASEKAKHELSSTFETEINIPFITSGSSGPEHLLVKFARTKLEELTGDLIKKSIDITRKVVEDSGLKMGEINEIILVGGQTRMPAMQKAVKDLFGREPNKSVNPDEVVAVGAAVQGGIMKGEVKDVLLLDVIPLSLGIETMGGVCTKIINKNTTIPTSKSQVFSTAADNQTSVEIHILQGEREMSADNKTLGRFILDGIPPSPRGMPQVEVTFDIDVNGILNVKAKDKTTNKEQSVRIEASSGLSKDDIEKMKKDAEAHAEDDKKKRESAEVKNNANGLIYTAEKSLSDAGDKVSAEVKKPVQDKIDELKKVKDGNDAEIIKKTTEELSKVLQTIGEAMRKSAQGGQQNQSGQAEQPKNEGGEGKTREADFEEKK
ncbi:MAG: molecular chaperone DnaK [Candidatus Terrybacteria bacterium RIFCSPLOWO2_02_42_20]|uniref:Chaperone protein DnaK n=2 Tax=Candidatus Terryibacteriota TaxID=1817920 RepID=A0A1G2PZ88_9BACT|nr:MAG: molecular chaperone DnaK [Candidatus Terrybacteria bacterium RIFCSPLOWO2_02_42_20]